MPETEHYFDEELLPGEIGYEYKPEHTAPEYGEPRDFTDARESLEIGKRAVLEQKGGEPEDWSLEYRGSGYRFDGEQIRDPEGAVWANEDSALHREMLEQWAEGGAAVFFLPDYREASEDGEALYVTTMLLGEHGEVTYEIHKHEWPNPDRKAEPQPVPEPHADLREARVSGQSLDDASEHVESSLDIDALLRSAEQDAEASSGESAPERWVAELLSIGTTTEQEVRAEPAELILQAFGLMSADASTELLPPRSNDDAAFPPQDTQAHPPHSRAAMRTAASSGITMRMAA